MSKFRVLKDPVVIKSKRANPANESWVVLFTIACNEQGSSGIEDDAGVDRSGCTDRLAIVAHAKTDCV